MNMMPGTMSPEQLGMVSDQQQPLIDALRQGGNPQMQQQQSQQQIIPVGSMVDPQVAALLGKGLGAGVNWLADDLSTANTYGTNPMSEQTRMLQAADAGLR